MLRLNPIYVFIKVTRDALFDTPLSSHDLSYLAVCSVAVFTIGFVFFWAHESEYSRAT